jgi:hypothetical protein
MRLLEGMACAFTATPTTPERLLLVLLKKRA